MYLFDFPGCLLQTVGQSSIFMCSLPIVCLCIQSLSLDTPEIFDVTSENDNKVFSGSWSSHGVDLTSQ